MELIKQNEIGVWVKASKELSKGEAIYRCPDRDGLRRVFWMYFEDSTQAGQFFSPIPLHLIEWLKPIKDVYVLTEVELTNIKMQEWSKGHQKGYENLRVHTHTDSDYDQ